MVVGLGAVWVLKGWGSWVWVLLKGGMQGRWLGVSVDGCFGVILPVATPKISFAFRVLGEAWGVLRRLFG